MKHLLFFLFAILIANLSSAQKSWESLKGPEITAKEFLRDVQKLESDAFGEKYSITTNEILEIAKLAKEDNLFSPEKMERLNHETSLEQREMLNKVVKRAGENIKLFQKQHTEILSKCSYYNYFYELKADNNEIAPRLNLSIIVKHKQGHFYLIYLPHALYANGTWKPFENPTIESCNEYGEYLFDEIKETDKVAEEPLPEISE